MNSVFALLPAYNEELNIEKVIEDWENQREALYNLNYKLKIIVVDDCSTDNTFIKVSDFLKIFDNIEILRHESNKGLGGAIRTGMDYVLNIYKNEDLIFVMDSDFTHKAKYSIDMIKEMTKKSSDVVIASRFQKGSEIFGVPRYRIFLSYFAKIYYTLTLNFRNVKDYTCGYRLYKICRLNEIKLVYRENYISKMGFACMVELLYKLNRIGSSFSEIPFSLHYEEKKGNSKMKVINTMIQSLLLPFHIKKS